MARSAYKCNISMSFIKDNTEYKIDENFINYIMIENLYESNYMPVIYVSVRVVNDIYSQLIQSEKNGKVYLRIDRFNTYSNTSLSKTYIEDQFTYICSTSNPNYTQVLDDNTMDQSYKQITLALMSMDILNKIKTSFNGIFGNIEHNTLIVKTLEGLNSVVKPVLYNPIHETIIIPAMNSKVKLLKFIFDECPFYDTNYIFFTDFNKTYLLDLTGEACDGGDGQLSTVMLDIRELTQEHAYYDGMEEKNGAYYIYINPAHTNVSENKGMDKISNQLVTIDDDGKVEYVDLDINNNIDSEVKQTFRRGGDTILYKNIVESNTVIIELLKENIDSTVLTPNKEYVINNYADYADYNGKYTLLYKKEVIKNINGEFGLSVSLGLRKVGNITSIGRSVVEEAIRRSKSAVGRYTRTDTKITTTTSKKSNNGNIATPTSTKNNSSSENTIVNKAIPMVKRMKATNDNSIRRQIRKISGED